MLFRSVLPRHQPFAVSVLTHVGEPRAKNSGVHLALLAAPGQVALHSLEAVSAALRAGDGGGDAAAAASTSDGGGEDVCPAFDPATSVVLYPSADSVLPDDLLPPLTGGGGERGAAAAATAAGEAGGGEEGGGGSVGAGVTRVFVIDSRWAKATSLLQRPELASLRRVRLPEGGPRTAFWRRKTAGAPSEVLLFMFGTLMWIFLRVRNAPR